MKLTEDVAVYSGSDFLFLDFPKCILVLVLCKWGCFTNYVNFFTFFFIRFIYWFLERAWTGRAEGEGESQADGMMSVELDRVLISTPWDHHLSQNQESVTYWLHHPGVPNFLCSVVTVLFKASFMNVDLHSHKGT